MKTLVQFCLGMTALGWMVGCSGAEEAAEVVGSATFNSTLADERELGALTGAESKKFCEEWSEWQAAQLADLKPLECRVQGLIDAQVELAGSVASDPLLQQSCQTSYDECAKAPAPSEPPPDCDAASIDISPECHGTVAEAEACRNEQFAAYKKVLGSVPECTSATLSYLQSDQPLEALEALGPSCKAFAAKCPEAFETNAAANASAR